MKIFIIGIIIFIIIWFSPVIYLTIQSYILDLQHKEIQTKIDNIKLQQNKIKEILINVSEYI